MKFCKMCGSPLDQDEGKPTKVSCHSCGGDTPAGYKFCQHCGSLLAKTRPKTGSLVSSAVKDEPEAPEVEEAPPPEPGGSMIPTQLKEPEEESARASISPASSPPPVPPDAVEAPRVRDSARHAAVSGDISAPGPVTSATPPAGIPAAAVSEAEPSVAADQVTAGPRVAKDSTASQPEQRAALANLVSVNRDGSDGAVHEITVDTCDLGRTRGQITFSDDPYLTSRHCRFYKEDGEWKIQDLSSCNGIYVRLTQITELKHGDMILIGKQVLLFELLDERELEISPALEHGVLVFGSPLRTPWARLSQVTVAGVARDIFHLHRKQVLVGREDGDMLFTEDEFLSRSHLLISNTGDKVQVQDQGSSNGSFLKIRQTHTLEDGDLIRVGDQLLRFLPL